MENANIFSMSTLTDILKTRLKNTTVWLEEWRLSRDYTKLHDNFNQELHIREALGWLIRAQDHGKDRGVSYGVKFGKGFLESYPETTGYIIQTFLDLSDIHGDPTLAERAVAMGDWEISVQMECGAVMGGKVTSASTPAIFNTGQVLCGWSDLLKMTGEPRYRQAGFRAAQWMTSVQDPDGNWSRGNSIYALPEATIYNVQAAWGLGLFGNMTGEEKFVQAAIRNAEYAIGHQYANGWFPRCCLDDPTHPLTHTLAYVTRGLLEIGLLSGRQDFIDAARKTINSVVEAVRNDGFLAGRFNEEWRGVVSWCCLTGSAQFSVILSKFFDLTGDDKYRKTAASINRFLMARHDISSKDPCIRGGVAGSWPVSGGYGRLMILNWATKYFIDALLAEKRITI